MEKNTTPLVDEHLQSIKEMQETGTDDFFFTRLKARMQKDETTGWTFPLKPVWVASTLTLLLAVNSFILLQQAKINKQPSANGSSIQQFAESYDQSISSSY